MNKLFKILDKEFITQEEMNYIIEHENVESVEDCGPSGQYYGKTWYKVTLINGQEFDIYLK